MDAQSYDQWYDSPRGNWIGQREAGLVLAGLQPRAGESLLDVGCGTGFFTRTLGAAMDGPLSAVDINLPWLQYARGRDPDGASYVAGDARALPYHDGSFDLVMSITALCFVDDETQAVAQMLRVARRRVAIGLLNRHSLLWHQKGRAGGSGAYRGARWHSLREARDLLRSHSVRNVQVSTAIALPDGGPVARAIDKVWPAPPACGAFILVVADIADRAGLLGAAR